MGCDLLGERASGELYGPQRASFLLLTPIQHSNVTAYLSAPTCLSPCFQAYAAACFDLFGDRVKSWITFNEPLTFSVCGYLWGIHAPGRSSDREVSPEGDSSVEPYAVVHAILRAHAAAVREFRGRFKVRFTVPCRERFKVRFLRGLKMHGSR